MTALVIRLAGLQVAPPGLWYDEARKGFHQIDMVEKGKWDWSYCVNEPLYTLPLWITGETLGLNVFGLRSASALIGGLTLPIFFLWARRILAVWPALFGTVLLAFSHWHLIFSGIAFRAILLPLFVCLTLWLFERFREKPDWRDGMALGIVLGLGLYSYIPFKTMPLLLLILALADSRGRQIFRRHWRPLAGIIIIVLLLALPLLIRALQNPDVILGRVVEVSEKETQQHSGLIPQILFTFSMFIWRGDSNPRHNIPGWPELHWLLIPFFIIGLVKTAMDPDRRRTVFLPWLWFLLPSMLSPAAPHALRAIGALCPAILLASHGMDYVMNRFSCCRQAVRLLVIMAGAGIILIVSAHSLYGVYGYWPKQDQVWRAFQAPYAELGDYLRRLPDNNIHVSFEAGERLTFQYMTRGRDIKYYKDTPPVVLPDLDPGRSLLLCIEREEVVGLAEQKYITLQLLHVIKSPEGTSAIAILKAAN